MRTSRMQAPPPKKKRKFTGFVIAAVVLGVAAYFVGASAAGGWLAQNVFDPVFNSSSANAKQTEEAATPQPDASVTPTDATQASSGLVEQNITADKLSLYTLQIGAFSDEVNANEAAKDVAAKGGAGYVAYDGNLYRVLLAGYTSKDDALSVRKNLADTDVDSTLFILESGSLQIMVGADAGQVSAIKACFDIVPSSAEKLQQIIYDNDNGKNVSADISALQKDAEQTKLGLEEAVDISDGAVKHLHAFMDDLCGMLSNLDVSDVDFSSELKYNLINIVVRYSSLLDELGS